MSFIEHKYTKAFVAGSAFPVMVWPFLYLGLSSRFNPNTSFIFATTPLILPVLVGLLNIFYILIEKRIPLRDTNNKFWLFGALHGLGLSLYGNFVSNIPVDLFALSGPIQYITIPLAIIAYGLIWRYAIQNLNRMVGLAQR